MTAAKAKLPASNDERIERTISFYDRNAENYFRSTVEFDLSGPRDRFIKRLPAGGLILDAGSGSGRDTKRFQEAGFRVEAFDASAELATLSSRFTGQKTAVKRFRDVEDEKRFDGIWACASLLHLPRNELAGSVDRLAKALKPNGVFYLSFQAGAGERSEPDGRFYVDLSTDELAELVAGCPLLELLELWTWEGSNSKGGRVTWVNALARRR